MLTLTRLAQGLAVSCSLLALVACRDDSPSSSGFASTGTGEGVGSSDAATSSTSTSSNASSSSTGSQGGSSATGSGGEAQGGAGPGSGGNTAGSGGAPSACSDIGAIDCFSNYDCDPADRCENVGTADLPLACCVPGQRGTGVLGQPCTSENDCASSLCIEGDTESLCSDKCTNPNDCIAKLPECIIIAFSNSNDKFCTP